MLSEIEDAQTKPIGIIQAVLTNTDFLSLLHQEYYKEKAEGSDLK